MNLAVKFSPSRDFFSCFERLADTVGKGGPLFLTALDPCRDLNVTLRELKATAREGNKIARDLYVKIHSTYIAPMFPEDVCSFADKMGGILDRMESTADRIALYHPPLDELMKPARVLNDSLIRIRKATYALEDKKNHSMILAMREEQLKLRKNIHEVLGQAAVSLWDRQEDAAECVKRKDILDRIEKAIHLSQDVVCLLERIVLKSG